LAFCTSAGIFKFLSSSATPLTMNELSFMWHLMNLWHFSLSNYSHNARHFSLVHAIRWLTVSETAHNSSVTLYCIWTLESTVLHLSLSIRRLFVWIVRLFCIGSLDDNHWTTMTPLNETIGCTPFGFYCMQSNTALNEESVRKHLFRNHKAIIDSMPKDDIRQFISSTATAAASTPIESSLVGKI
jgi:hypothetical protein